MPPSTTHFAQLGQIFALPCLKSLMGSKSLHDFQTNPKCMLSPWRSVYQEGLKMHLFKLSMTWFWVSTAFLGMWRKNSSWLLKVSRSSLRNWRAQLHCKIQLLNCANYSPDRSYLFYGSYLLLFIWALCILHFWQHIHLNRKSAELVLGQRGFYHSPRWTVYPGKLDLHFI